MLTHTLVARTKLKKYKIKSSSDTSIENTFSSQNILTKKATRKSGRNLYRTFKKIIEGG